MDTTVKDNQIKAIEKVMSERNWPNARHLILNHIREYGQNPWLLRKLAWVYLQMDKDSEALKFAKKAYQIAPKDSLVLRNYGRILWLTQHDDKAIRIFERFVRISPAKLAIMDPKGGKKWALYLINDCRFNIGVSYYELRKSDMAKKWLSEYLEKCSPYKSDLWKKKEAQEILEKLKDTRKIEVLLNKGEWAKAQPLLKKQIKKEPRNFWLRTRLAETYYELDKYQKAYEVVKKAHKLAPDKPLCMWYYGCILGAVGRKRKAISVFKKILRKGERRIALRDTTAGIRWARWLMNESRLRIAFCYEDIGNIPMAITWFKKHINNRRPGVSTDYSQAVVHKFLKELKRRAQSTGAAVFAG